MKQELAGPAADSTLARRIYDSLLRRILDGELPPGARLDETMLAAQFGVSRTPVREALRELGARRLIDLVPRRGGVVSRIAMETLADMLDAECELEALCARMAAQRMTTLQRVRLQEIHERIRELIAREALDEFYDCNNAFHDLVLAGAHNHTLDEAARDLRSRLSPFRRTGLETPEEQLIALNFEDHAAIAEAILAARAEDAYEAMRSHNARVNAKALRHYRRVTRAGS
jgi:DNA-binding GntR family transcriptional regulator